MTNLMRIAAILEGHVECEAVPILFRRIAPPLTPTLTVLVHNPA